MLKVPRGQVLYAAEAHANCVDSHDPGTPPQAQLHMNQDRVRMQRKPCMYHVALSHQGHSTRCQTGAVCVQFWQRAWQQTAAEAHRWTWWKKLHGLPVFFIADPRCTFTTKSCSDLVA